MPEIYDLSLKNLIKILILIQDKGKPSQKDVKLSEHVLSKGEDWRGSESPPGISLPLFGKITQYGLYSTI